MAWVFEKSRTWRIIVTITKQHPVAMVGFSALCFGAPYYLGKATMGATNPQLQAEREQQLRQNTSMHQKAQLCTAHSG